MQLRIDKENNIAYIKLSGQLDRKIILDAFDQTVSDKDYKHGMGRLWDFTDADLSLLSSSDVIDMAQYSMKFPPGINDVKVAFVTSGNLSFGLSRMFASTSLSDTPIKVYKRIEEAEGWLSAVESKTLQME